MIKKIGRQHAQNIKNLAYEQPNTNKRSLQRMCSRRVNVPCFTRDTCHRLR